MRNKMIKKLIWLEIKHLFANQFGKNLLPLANARFQRCWRCCLPARGYRKLPTAADGATKGGPRPRGSLGSAQQGALARARPSAEWGQPRTETSAVWSHYRSERLGQGRSQAPGPGAQGEAWALTGPRFRLRWWKSPGTGHGDDAQWALWL